MPLAQYQRAIFIPISLMCHFWLYPGWPPTCVFRSNVTADSDEMLLVTPVGTGGIRSRRPVSRISELAGRVAVKAKADNTRL